MTDRTPPGIIPRVLRHIDFVGKMDLDRDDMYMTYEEPVVADLATANVQTSVVDDYLSTVPDNLEEEDFWSETHHHVNHAPVLDLDFPCQLLPSSTPGHFHLVMDIMVPWMKYRRVLEAMADAGMLESGYVDASIQRGYTSIRLPWVKRVKPRHDDVSENKDTYEVTNGAGDVIHTYTEKPTWEQPTFPDHDHLDL